jgi:hypothetical protein
MRLVFYLFLSIYYYYYYYYYYYSVTLVVVCCYSSFSCSPDSYGSISNLMRSNLNVKPPSSLHKVNNAPPHVRHPNFTSSNSLSSLPSKFSSTNRGSSSHQLLDDKHIELTSFQSTSRQIPSFLSSSSQLSASASPSNFPNSSGSGVASPKTKRIAPLVTGQTAHPNHTSLGHHNSTVALANATTHRKPSSAGFSAAHSLSSSDNASQPPTTALLSRSGSLSSSRSSLNSSQSVAMTTSTHTAGNSPTPSPRAHVSHSPNRSPRPSQLEAALLGEMESVAVAQSTAANEVEDVDGPEADGGPEEGVVLKRDDSDLKQLFPVDLEEVLVDSPQEVRVKKSRAIFTRVPVCFFFLSLFVGIVFMFGCFYSSCCWNYASHATLFSSPGDQEEA